MQAMGGNKYNNMQHQARFNQQQKMMMNEQYANNGFAQHMGGYGNNNGYQPQQQQKMGSFSQNSNRMGGNMGYGGHNGHNGHNRPPSVGFGIDDNMELYNQQHPDSEDSSTGNENDQNKDNNDEQINIGAYQNAQSYKTEVSYK